VPNLSHQFACVAVEVPGADEVVAAEEEVELCDVAVVDDSCEHAVNTLKITTTIMSDP